MGWERETKAPRRMCPGRMRVAVESRGRRGAHLSNLERHRCGLIIAQHIEFN